MEARDATDGSSNDEDLPPDGGGLNGFKDGAELDGPDAESDVLDADADDLLDAEPEAPDTSDGASDADGPVDSDLGDSELCQPLEVRGDLPTDQPQNFYVPVSRVELALPCGSCPYSAVLRWIGSDASGYTFCEENATWIVLFDGPPSTCNDAPLPISCAQMSPSLGDGEYYLILCRDSPDDLELLWLEEASCG